MQIANVSQLFRGELTGLVHVDRTADLPCDIAPRLLASLSPRLLFTGIAHCTRLPCHAGHTVS